MNNLLRVSRVLSQNVIVIRRMLRSVEITSNSVNHRIKTSKSTKQSDVFGTLSKEKDICEDFDIEDEYDAKFAKYDESRGALEKPVIKEYAESIKKYLQERKLGKAIHVLETKMLLEDGVLPNQYIYNLLIGGCGREGYTEQAFKLFNNMKKRALKPDASTYTGLFNSCANSPFPTEALNRARHLRQLMVEKAYIPNTVNYHAMIKAFGHCGDIDTAFELVDEMMESRHVISSETFAFLLQACASDKESGFMNALMVWRKMRQMRIRQTPYTYNLLIRCIRDCGVGKDQQEINQQPINLLDKLLKVLPPRTKGRRTNTDDSSEASIMDLTPRLNDGNEQELRNNNDVMDQLVSTSKTITSDTLPNILGLVIAPGNVVAIGSLTTLKDRLVLLGGMQGILRNMKQDKVEANIKTFTELLEVIPQDIKSEMSLLNEMSEWNVKPDTDFFNIMIKRRNYRHDNQAARNVLELMQEHSLCPDIVTFGVLALGCYNYSEAVAFLKDIDNAGFHLNTIIVGTLMKKACLAMDPYYVIAIMNLAKDHSISPDPRMLESLEKFRKTTLTAIVKKEKGQVVTGKISSKQFQKGWRVFSFYYRSWLRQMNVELPVHPWAQFK